MRVDFSSPTKREAYRRSGGFCECHLVPWLRRPNGCGARLGDGNTFYEHIEPSAISGRNDLENCAVLCKICWKEKTARYDLPVIAKSNRQRDRARGIKRQPMKALPGTVRSGIKTFLDGSPPVWRDSGKPVFRR